MMKKKFWFDFIFRFD